MARTAATRRLLRIDAAIGKILHSRAQAAIEAPCSNPRVAHQHTRVRSIACSLHAGPSLRRLDEAARHLDLDADVLEKLKYPRETTKVRLMIRMDDGSRKSFMAWRCRYDDTRGPTKGGIRFHPD